MKAYLLMWAYLPAFGGAVYAFKGYDPKAGPQWVANSLPGMVSVASFGVVMIVVLMLLMPVILLLNEGRCDWRKVRIGAVQLAVFFALWMALLFGGIGAYQLAGVVSGGWPGGWLAAPVGGLIGAALGFLVGLVAARLGIGERLGIGNQKTA